MRAMPLNTSCPPITTIFSSDTSHGKRKTIKTFTSLQTALYISYGKSPTNSEKGKMVIQVVIWRYPWIREYKRCTQATIELILNFAYFAYLAITVCLQLFHDTPRKPLPPTYLGRFPLVLHDRRGAE